MSENEDRGRFKIPDKYLIGNYGHLFPGPLTPENLMWLLTNPDLYEQYVYGGKLHDERSGGKPPQYGLTDKRGNRMMFGHPMSNPMDQADPLHGPFPYFGRGFPGMPPMARIGDNAMNEYGPY